MGAQKLCARSPTWAVERCDTRFCGRPGPRRSFPSDVGNKLLTTLSNMFSDLNLTDMETCYKVMVRKVADRLDLQSRDFGIEPEITQKVAAMRARIYEVPISYHGRTYEEGKKIGLERRLQGRLYDRALLRLEAQIDSKRRLQEFCPAAFL